MGTTSQSGTNPSVLNPVGSATSTAYNVGQGMQTDDAENLDGTGGNAFNEMAFSIEKVTVTAKSRALKAEYSLELAQDLKAIHGLNAEGSELANILSTEILAEINREVIRTIYKTAEQGAVANVATAGEFDLDIDSNGRWSVEKFKGLLFQIERDANAIAQRTRRGKGNIILCSADVASALTMAGVLDYTPALNANLNVDDTGNTFAGVLQGKYRVYIDPYAANLTSANAASNSGNQYYVVGYKGTSPYDAGLFYCPYVPLQMVRAVGENSFQPPRLTLRPATAWSLTHSQQEPPKDWVTWLLTLTATIVALLLRTSCDPLDTHFTEGPSGPSFLSKYLKTMTNSNLNRIENRNYLAPTGFRFILDRTPGVTYFCNSANIPALDLAIAIQPTYLKDIDVPGDKLAFGDLSVRFLVDEDLTNYMEIQNWMRGLGYPQDLKQLHDLQQVPSNRAYEERSRMGENIFSDATLAVMTSNNITNFFVKFRECFPYSLTSLNFDTTDSDVQYFTAEVSFKYTYYEITDLNGKLLHK